MNRFPGNASELPASERFCTCCQRPLVRKIAWLELDQRVDAYHDLGGVPPDKSQGWFPFGLTCAKKLKDLALRRHSITKDGNVAKVSRPLP